MAMVIALPDIGLVPKLDQAGYFGGFLTKIWLCPECGKLDCERSCIVYADDPMENPQGCLVQTMALHLGVDSGQDLLQAMVDSNKAFDQAMEEAKAIVEQIHALVNSGQLNEAYLLAVAPCEIEPMVQGLLTDGSIEANQILARFSWNLADAANQIIAQSQGKPDPQDWIDKMMPSLSSALKYLVGTLWEQFRARQTAQAAQQHDFGSEIAGMPIRPNQNDKLM